MISLVNYIKAMEIVKEYESQLKPPEGNLTGLCRCKKCKLKFGFNSNSITREEHNAGSYRYYGKCPYCDQETLLTTY